MAVKTVDDYIRQFDADMEAVIKTWETYEQEFYNNTVKKVFNNTIYYPLLAGGKSAFPKLLFNEIVLNNSQVDFELDKLEKTVQKGMAEIESGTISMKKGGSFENFISSIVLEKQDLAQLFPDKLEHTGPSNLREDFSITKTYTMDVKYSDLSTDERFKNIIKPWGSGTIRNISDIEESIIRSLYSSGALHGRYLPQNEAVTNLGIYDIITGKDGSKLFEEITQSRYLQDFPNLTNSRGKKVSIPSNRKILIFLFNDNGYWTTECLRTVVNWAKGRMKELGFKNSKVSYNTKDFWKMTFYGKNK